MDTVTIRLNKDESRIYSEYAKLNDLPLSTLFKKTLEEKMQVEFDMQAIAEYEGKDSHDTYTHEELKETLDL